MFIKSYRKINFLAHTLLLACCTYYVVELVDEKRKACCVARMEM